ncbi:hypothetical protein JTE90_009714 [Oedothorax gibbosus]|uniref:Uncharacterized protein n=1 Tax=Oedothorax gibbosus TaxID=931172 RepID=A0AAV6VAL6_9ARAC|nr:hypothetical protein JTE90_009714 [Oedothorax gibbosus]
MLLSSVIVTQARLVRLLRGTLDLSSLPVLSLLDNSQNKVSRKAPILPSFLIEVSFSIFITQESMSLKKFKNLSPTAAKEMNQTPSQDTAYTYIDLCPFTI